MSGLMNGKPYFGVRRPGMRRKPVSHSGLDYSAINQIVEDGIRMGLIIPPTTLQEILPVVKPTPKIVKYYGTGTCKECSSGFKKVGWASVICLKCRDKSVPCPICRTPFKRYRNNKSKLITCSNKCGIEYMRRGKKGKDPHRNANKSR